MHGLGEGPLATLGPLFFYLLTGWVIESREMLRLRITESLLQKIRIATMVVLMPAFAFVPVLPGITLQIPARRNLSVAVTLLNISLSFIVLSKLSHRRKNADPELVSNSLSFWVDVFLPIHRSTCPST